LLNNFDYGSRNEITLSAFILAVLLKGRNLFIALMEEFFLCSDVAVLKDIESRDPLSEISEQEKELLWTYR